MSFSKLVYFLSSLILSIWLSASAAVWADGTPAGFTITSPGNELSVVAFNFSNAYTTEEVNELYSFAALVYGLLGAEGTITPYSPDQIKSMGYDGDSLHSWLVSILSEFQSYVQIKVGKYTISSRNVHILDLWAWAPGDTAGFYIGDLEIPDEPALFDLLNILSEGSRYINIVTYAPRNNGIAQVLRMEFYYMESATATRAYLGAIEISQEAMQSAFDALLSGL